MTVKPRNRTLAVTGGPTYSSPLPRHLWRDIDDELARLEREMRD